MKTEPDGSFKRADATFRNTIRKGSRFEPEHGGGFSYLLFFFWAEILFLPRSLSPLCFLCLSYVLHYRWTSTNSYWRIDWHISTAWATRTLIVRKLKGLESIIRRCSQSNFYLPETRIHTTYVSCYYCIASHGLAGLAFCPSWPFPWRRWRSIVPFRTCKGPLFQSRS